MVQILFVLLLLLFCQGCDIKGAKDPYSYAPSSSHSVWNPPAKAKKRLPFDELNKDLNDSNLFGILETLDHTKGLDESVKKVRYQAMRDALIKEYSFYRYDFYAFSSYGISGFFTPSDKPI